MSTMEEELWAILVMKKKINKIKRNIIYGRLR